MTTICFLHGFAASGAVWHRYRSEFPNAVMPTLQFTLEGTPLLPHLTRKTLLVGWSLGGMAAVEMTARQPEKVAGLVLISSAPSFVASDLFPEGKPLSALHEMRDGIVRNDPRTLQSFQRQLFTAEEIKNGWLNRFRREIRPLLMEDTATASLLAQLAFLERWRVPPTLPDIPVTVIHGDGDTVVSVAAVTAWQKVFPQATTVTVKGGHALPFTHSETITTTIHSLLHDEHTH